MPTDNPGAGLPRWECEVCVQACISERELRKAGLSKAGD